MSTYHGLVEVEFLTAICLKALVNGCSHLAGFRRLSPHGAWTDMSLIPGWPPHDRLLSKPNSMQGASLRNLRLSRGRRAGRRRLKRQGAVPAVLLCWVQGRDVQVHLSFCSNEVHLTRKRSASALVWVFWPFRW